MVQAMVQVIKTTTTDAFGYYSIQNVAQEIHRTLEAHELIKIKLQVHDREKRKAMIEEICGTHQAESVQSIGHVVLLYRAAKRPVPRLSNLIRKFI